MPAAIQREANNTYILRISGTLQRSEFGQVQGTTAAEINAGARPRILVILTDFKGWERGAEWGDLETLFSHGHQIEKIAIAGDPSWEGEALAFAGAGFRRTPVQFFPADQQAQARAWLAQ